MGRKLVTFPSTVSRVVNVRGLEVLQLEDSLRSASFIIITQHGLFELYTDILSIFPLANEQKVEGQFLHIHGRSYTRYED